MTADKQSLSWYKKMEGSENVVPERNRTSRVWESVRKWFGRKVDDRASDILHVEEPEQRFDTETISRVLDKANKLLQANPDKFGEGFVLPTFTGGGIRAKEMAELMGGQPTLKLYEADRGDVVWWRDEKGHTGYFLIEKPYRDDKGHNTYGSGAIKAEIDDGLIESENATVIGASFGGMIMIYRVAENIPVEFSIPDQGTYRTYPVEKAGIVKASDLTEASNS